MSGRGSNINVLTELLLNHESRENRPHRAGGGKAAFIKIVDNIILFSTLFFVFNTNTVLR